MHFKKEGTKLKSNRRWKCPVCGCNYLIDTSLFPEDPTEPLQSESCHICVNRYGTSLTWNFDISNCFEVCDSCQENRVPSMQCKDCYNYICDECRRKGIQTFQSYG